MLEKLEGLFALIKSLLILFIKTDFTKVNFGSLYLALGVCFLLIVALFFKLLFGHQRFSHFFSGFNISNYYQESFLIRIVYIFPKLVMLFAVIFLLIALADPFISQIKTEKIVLSHERVELIDNSSSMGWQFKNTNKSACEIAREAHLEFLRMRRGQNDRVALWVFATNAYKIEDFITDDDVYEMQVANAPCVIVGKSHSSLPENDPHDLKIDIIAPKHLVRKVEDDSEGATRLDVGLRAVIKYFDQEGSKIIKNKSLIIITDAAIENYPAAELEELKNKNIVVYMFHVDPNEIGEKQFDYYNNWKIERAQQLKESVIKYGGKVFSVSDKRSAKLAFEEINRLEKASIKSYRYVNKISIFQRPLVVSALLTTLALILAMFIEIIWVRYP